MISVVIRTKNQKDALSFLLGNLTRRYVDDIDEIIVVDNLSTDGSDQICKDYGARLVTIENFSYGGSANIAARESRNDIVVIFSAHSYPVSHDFFKLIKQGFEGNKNLAGLRCLHSTNDYRAYITDLKAKENPNRAGLIFSGSAFRRSVWEKHPFREDVATFEDKEWSKRVLEAGYEIEFVPAIFHYEIKRSRKQEFFRFKNDMVGNYQLWHKEVSLLAASNGVVATIFWLKIGFIKDVWYAIKRYLHTFKFVVNKPKKF
ncbi:glycosyltransferase [Dokdonia sinensis]|uniref:Glycosyltransferase n=1 Tax=Dokdonia sinensis TaxID=2479847 RepID=A0A3M0FY36_9FLAO|nr:glycosyltransferase [Dokdonia sinensis]RMB57425.1 glycosyltransferase [Dokdonia sinensis]